MIETHDIEKRFGRIRAVRGVRFTADKGEIVGLLGPNGAGKTTTLRIITGFLPPDAGRVLVDGLDTLNDSLAARRRIGYLPESTPLYPELTVVAQLHHRARLFGLRGRSRAAAVDRAIERCWLGEVRRRRVGQLSKGYRQRVGLAAALVHNPPTLILDEPTNGLDPTQISQIRTLLRELSRDHTVILSSHILGEVEKTCDRVIVMARGRVRADAQVNELAGGADGAPRCVVVVRAGDTAAVEAFRTELNCIENIQSINEESIPDEPDWRRWIITPRSCLTARFGVCADTTLDGGTDVSPVIESRKTGETPVPPSRQTEQKGAARIEKQNPESDGPDARSSEKKSSTEAGWRPGCVDLPARVGEAASRTGVALRELRALAPSLESVFLELISQAERAEGAEGAEP